MITRVRRKILKQALASMIDGLWCSCNTDSKISLGNMTTEEVDYVTNLINRIVIKLHEGV